MELPVDLPTTCRAVEQSWRMCCLVAVVDVLQALGLGAADARGLLQVMSWHGPFCGSWWDVDRFLGTCNILGTCDIM